MHDFNGMKNGEKGQDESRKFENVIRIDEGEIRSHVDEVVRESVEETLNGLLDAEAARKKAADVVAKLESMKLGKAATIVREGVEETLSYMSFPSEHWRQIRTNNPLERIMREIRRRTRVVGAFPDGRSTLMLVAARLRHIAGTHWGARRYLDMARLKEQDQEKQATEEELLAVTS